MAVIRISRLNFLNTTTLTITIRSIQQLDRALQAKLAEKEPTYEAINNLIAE